MLRLRAVRPLASLLAAGLVFCAVTYGAHRGMATQSTAAGNGPGADAIPRRTGGAGSLPLHFEENRGQAPGSVRFVSRGAGYALFVSPTETALSLSRPSRAGEPSGRTGALPSQSARTLLRTQLVGANRNAAVVGENRSACRTSYFIGSDRRNWLSDVPSFNEVRCKQVYPGVDVRYYGNSGGLEYDFELAPGVDPKQIRCDVRGAASLTVSPSGRLVMHTGAGDVEQERPEVYQMVGGRKKAVGSRFALRGLHQFGFEIAPFDRTLPLVIDPKVNWCTYFGGDGAEDGNAIAQMRSGGTFYTVIAGRTTSLTTAPPYNAFPVTSAGPNSIAAYQSSIGSTSSSDGYIAVFSSVTNPSTQQTTQTLLYCTYFGGTGDDTITGIACPYDGLTVCFTGITKSLNLPVTNNALRATYAGGASDAFCGILSLPGRTPAEQLAYSTYLGGSGEDIGSGITGDAAGNIYLTGSTASPNFPVTSGAYHTNFGGGAAGNHDAYLTALKPGALLFSTYIGATGDDLGSAVALDGSGSVLATGQLGSGSGSYGGADAFVIAFDATTGLAGRSKVLGGGGDDYGQAITVDQGSGRVYVAGSTTPPPSGGAAFPTVNPIQIAAGNGRPAYNGGVCHGSMDAFVTALTPIQGSWSTAYSTYLGGGGVDYATCISTGYNTGRVMIGGYTDSSDLPLGVAGTGSYHGNGDGMFAWIDTRTQSCFGTVSLLGADYFGGGQYDVINGMLGADGSGAFVGTTTSSGLAVSPPGFTVFQSAIHPQGQQGGGPDAFVAGLSFESSTATPSVISGTVISSSEIDLTWTIPAGADTVEIWRKDSCNSDWTKIREFAANVTTYADTGLWPLVTYSYKAIAKNCYGLSPVSNIIDLTTLDDAPAAPQNLYVTAVNLNPTPGYVSLSWFDASTNEDFFSVERAVNAGAFSELVRVPTAQQGPNCIRWVSWTDNTTQPGNTYSYRVRSHSAIGLWSSAYTNTVKVGGPLAPSSLNASASTSTSVYLTWFDNSGNEDGFRIERSADGVTYTEIGVAPPNANSYSDTTVSPNTTSYYRIRSYNASAMSGYTNVAVGNTNVITASVAQRDDTSAVVTLTNVPINAITLVVLTLNLDGSLAGASSGSPDVTRNIFGLQTGIAYTFRAYAQFDHGTGLYSDPVSLTLHVGAPTGLTVALDPSNPSSAVILQWTSPNVSANTKQRIFRSTSPAGPFSYFVSGLAATVTSAGDASLSEASTYYYYVQAYGLNGETAVSNVASITLAPSAPAGLTATLDATQRTSKVNLTWTVTTATNATYSVERSTDGVNFTTAATGVAGNSYSDTGLQPATTYYYRVKAVFGGLSSNYSNTATAATAPPAPTITVSGIDSNTMSVQWAGYSGSGTVLIERAPGGTTNFVQVGTVALPTTSFTDTGVQPDTNVAYRARVLTNGTYSDYSATVTTFTPPAAPAVSASPYSNSQIRLDWTAGYLISEYRIFRSTNATTGFVQVQSIPSVAQPVFYDAGLSAGTRYYYRVVSVGYSGNSSPGSADARTYDGATPTLEAVVQSTTSVKLTWSSYVAGGTVKIEGGPTTVTITNGSTSTTITGLTPQTTYSFRVQVWSNNQAYTGWSLWQGAFTGDPADPSGLSATPGSTSGTVNLTWTDNSLGEQGFKVMRSQDGVNFTLVTTTSPGATSYTDIGRTAGHFLYYRVKAVNGISVSNPSNTATATVP